MLKVTFTSKQSNRSYTHEYNDLDACKRFIYFLMDVSFVHDIQIHDANGIRVYHPWHKTH